MEITTTRKWFSENCAISELAIDDKFFCYCLEDKDRDLDSEMPMDSINARKVYGKTAIPTGRYEVIVNMSNRFKVMMPLLLKVKGYEGVRIHTGNTDKDTEGCLILGLTKGADAVYQSKNAYNAFMPIVNEALKNGEHIYITIKRQKVLDLA